MKFWILIGIINLFLLFDVHSNESIKVIYSDDVQKLKSNKNDTTYLIHLWATWCAPCIKEIPDLLKIEEQLKNKKFKLILISLDFENQIQSKLVPFLAKNEMKPPYYLLKQERGYEWINKIDSNWSGSIPASIIFNKDHYGFYEKSFLFDELNKLLITKYLIP